MSIRFSLSFSLLFVYLQTLTLTLIPALPTDSPFNVSEALLPKIDASSHFLKDVLKAISSKHGWLLEDIRVSKLDAGTARFGHSQRYEFRVRIGKSLLVFEFWDKETRWKKAGERDSDFGTLISGISSSAVLDSFRIEGPFDLSAQNRDDELLLLLPMNSTHSGLKRILVGEGITVEVRNAQEVSLFHASALGFPVTSSLVMNLKGIELWSFRNSFCFPLLPVKISGSASLVAYRTQNPNAHIQSNFLSNRTIELQPEKCYSRYTYRRHTWPVDFLNLRVAVVRKLLRSFLSDRVSQNRLSSFVTAQVKASTVVQFQLELERDIRSNDTFYDMMAEWRTRPRAEQVRFKVVARIEDERLKPMAFKKLKPFVEADSVAWSSLMSNISFTNFPSILVPPEALTLDVKW